MTERNSTLPELFSKLDPVEHLIFLGAISAIVRKCVTAEAAMQDAQRLVDRHHDGKQILVSDFPAEWRHPEGEHA